MHVFLELNVRGTVQTVHDLMFELKHHQDVRQRFVMSAEVAKFMRDLLVVNTTLPTFKNCKFAFADGEFLEIDAKGKTRLFSDPVPDWYMTERDFMRSNWFLENNELADLVSPQFVDEFITMFPDVEMRRYHADLLFDLQLDKLETSTPRPAASQTGNKNGKTTAPRVTDLQSFELFQQFYDRLKAAAESDQFPSLQVLADSPDVMKLPAAVKQSYRTWYKAITDELPPNNKKIEAGNADIYCAQIRERLAAVEAVGLERYYHQLSEAIKAAGDATINTFTFTPKP